MDQSELFQQKKITISTQLYYKSKRQLIYRFMLKACNPRNKSLKTLLIILVTIFIDNRDLNLFYERGSKFDSDIYHKEYNRKKIPQGGVFVPGLFHFLLKTFFTRLLNLF